MSSNPVVIVLDDQATFETLMDTVLFAVQYLPVGPARLNAAIIRKTLINSQIDLQTSQGRAVTIAKALEAIFTGGVIKNAHPSIIASINHETNKLNESLLLKHAYGNTTQRGEATASSDSQPQVPDALQAMQAQPNEGGAAGNPV